MSEGEALAAAVAEKYVIGALLADPSMVRKVREEVSREDFADMRLGDIYRGILSMADAREPIDYLTVWDRLAGWDVRGVDLRDLAQWSSAVPTPTAAPYYAGTVREAAMTRDMIRIAQRMTDAAMAGGVMPGVLVGEAIQSLRELRDQRGGSFDDHPLRTLGEVLDVPATEDRYDWVVPGLLERRDRLMLTGSEGGGKSTFLRQIAVMIAAGLHPFTGEQVEPKRVLVIDAENSERQWRRAVKNLVIECDRRGVVSPRANLWLHFETRMVDITRPADQGRFHRYVDEAKPDLLLIGPLYKLVPKSIKDDDDAAPVLAALDSIRERDVAMMIEAHAGHGDSRTGVRDLRPRGSSALLGWPEFGMGLAKPQKIGDPFRLLRWRGDRDERNWPFELNRQRDMPQLYPWEPTAAWRQITTGGDFTPPSTLI